MKKATFEKDLPSALDKLTDNQKPLWGIMTPQHMIEHLIVTYKISRGRIRTELLSAEGLEKRLEFLMSDIPYEKNIQIPALQGRLQKLRLADLESAKLALLEELPLFHQFFEENPEAKPVNPIFGALNKAQWEQLHYKHCRHHLSQFGLI